MDGVFSAACRLENSRAAAAAAANEPPVPIRMPDPTLPLDNGGAARRGLQQLLRSSTGLIPSSLGSRSSSPASSFRRQASMTTGEKGEDSVQLEGRLLPPASSFRRQASMAAEGHGGAGGSRSSSPAPSYRRQASMSAAAAAEGRRSGNGSGPSSPASSSSYRRQASSFGTAAERQSGGGGGGGVEAGDGGGGGNPRGSCSRLAMAQLMASFDSQCRYIRVFP